MGIAAIVVYVVALIILGYVAMRRTHSVGDFFLGGRTLGPWMSAFAYGTTYFSAVLFIGYGGKLGWGFGLHTMWIVLGNVVLGSLLAWWVLGRRTREMTARLNAMTMPAFLGERFNSVGLKIAAAAIIFIFLVPYSASVYMGLSYLFEQALGISYQQALSILAVMTGVYLVMGGYFAIALTDFLMGIVMIFGVGVMLILLGGKSGGLFHAAQLLSNQQICSPALKAGPPGSIPGWLTLLSLVIITSMGPWGLPQMVQKFYSIKDGGQIKRAMIVASLFALLMTFGGYFTGAMTHLNLPDRPGVSVSAASGESTGPYVSPKSLPVKSGPDGKPMIAPNGKPVVDWDRSIPSFLLHKLPPWVVMLIALLVFSASMSTLSSLVLVSSSAIAMDLYAGVIKPNVEQKTVLLMMRVLCAMFVALSLAIALVQPAYIVTLMVISWGVVAGAFAAPYLYGLFWRRTTTMGAACGMISGVGIGVILAWVLGDPGITPNDPAIPIASAVAIILPFAVVPIVSLLTRPLPQEVIDRAFTPGSEG